MTDVGKFKVFMDGLKDLATGVGKFYVDNAETINDGVKTYAAIRAINKKPDDPLTKGDMLTMAYLNSGSGSGAGIGAKGFFASGAKVDVDDMEEKHPDGDNGVYKFKITGFSSSPFIKLKR